MKLSRLDQKYWQVEPKATVPCAVTHDGLVVMFQLADVENVLNEKYPREKNVWFFNETKDREIAEIYGDRVKANPQVLWRHFLT